MKKNLMFFSMLLMTFFALSVVSASIDVDSVTLDGGTSIIVDAGDLVDTEVTVTTAGVFDNWESTSYRIEGTGWTCVDTGDHTVDGTYSEDFDISIPPLVAGEYDFDVRVFQYVDDCTGTVGDSFTLTDAIIVEDDACIIDVDMPLVGAYYADDVPIEWSLSDDCTSPTYNLHYYEGSCTPASPTLWTEIADTVNALEYDWASGFDEAEMCVRVSEDEGDDYGVMAGTFYIDNIDPIADADGPYVCFEGDSVGFDGSGSSDPGVYASGIASWDWYVDGSYVGSGEYFDYDCLDGDATLDVDLIVTDNVGNDDSDDSTVQIFNINPWACSIDGPTDLPVGFLAEFEGSAIDVPADMPKLEFNWDFDDGNTATDENPTLHTYTTAGLYTVELTVIDTDGGSVSCEYDIDVVEPTILDAQEVAAFYPLEADFGGDGDGNEFYSGLPGATTTDCDFFSGPTNMDAVPTTNGCDIFWDAAHSANPTNDERGTHNAIIRVEDNLGNYDYFTFDTTVWSWIINLHEGQNLISIPLVPEYDNSIENVFLDQLNGQGALPGGSEYVIWSYQFDADTMTSSWLNSRASGYGNLNTVMPGYGYWVKVNQEAVIKGMGVKTETLGPRPTVEVSNRQWNLIGRYGIVGAPWPFFGSDDDRVHGFLLKDTALDNVKKLDNTLHVYGEDGSETGILTNNEGYWMLVEEHVTLPQDWELYTPIDNWYEHN